MSPRQTSSRRGPIARDSALPQYLVVGLIVAPRGLRGELKVRIESDDPERFSDLQYVFLGPELARWAVESSRPFGDFVLLMLTGVSDREAAETLRGLTVYVDQDEALPLEEGEYYQFQIKGLSVRTQDGQDLGSVTEVLETGANDVYVVVGSAGELLLPAIRDVILGIDIAAGTMTVRVPEGLAD
jgi:16S rRNA processing protein RimM